MFRYAETVFCGAACEEEREMNDFERVLSYAVPDFLV